MRGDPPLPVPIVLRAGRDSQPPRGTCAGPRRSPGRGAEAADVDVDVSGTVRPSRGVEAAGRARQVAGPDRLVERAEAELRDDGRLATAAQRAGRPVVDVVEAD